MQSVVRVIVPPQRSHSAETFGRSESQPDLFFLFIPH
jgi:hypothetical protein